MTHLFRDVRYGLRMLGKNPGLTAAGVLALALGIGLTAAMFSIVNGVLFQSLPFERSDRLVSILAANPGQNEQRVGIYFKDFLDWKARQKSFEALAAFDATTVNLSDDEARPERLEGAHMSADTFRILRAKPLLGRTFLPGEDAPGAPPVALLGYGLWKSRYGGDPDVIGRTIRVNGKPSTVVGVMPENFGFPVSQVIWSPLQVDPARAVRGAESESAFVSVFGRLADGVSLDQATAEMAAIGKAVAVESPQTHKGVELTVQPYTREFVGGPVVGMLYTMLGAVALVLLLACANVASLMMARASRRTRELAIRSAMGAGRRRVLAQILVESLLLALAGAAGGLLLARWGLDLFNTVILANTEGPPPFWFHIALDPRSVLVTLGLTLAAGLLSGLLPALQASRADAADVLKDEGRGSTSLRMGRFTRAVVVLEVALSCALLVCAGLMVKSIVQIQTLDLGFEESGLLTFRVALYEADYPELADRTAFWRDLLPRLQAMPGVEAAAAISSLPTNGTIRESYALEGRAYPRPEDQPRALVTSISPGAFDTFQARLLAGRDFGPQDLAGALPVAIVNRSFAERSWPGQEAVGRRIKVGQGEKAVWRTVVGVAPDLQMEGLESDLTPHGFYLPIAQDCPSRVSVAVRTPGAPEALAAQVRAEVAKLDKDLPIYFVQSMEQAVAQNAFFFNLFGSLFAIFGVCALVLAGVGIYGVVAFSVAQRTQEIGVRMALGAGHRAVLGMILRQGAWQLAGGLGVGLLLAFGLSRSMSSLLFHVEPTDPSTFAGVAVILAGVTLVACLIPARRATRIDPLVAIRYD